MAAMRNTVVALVLFCHHISTTGAFVLPTISRASVLGTTSTTTATFPSRIQNPCYASSTYDAASDSRQRRGGWRRWFSPKTPKSFFSSTVLRKAVMACTLVASVLLSPRPSWAAASKASKIAAVATTATATTTSTVIPTVSLVQLGMAAALVYYTGVVTLQMQGNNLQPLAFSLAKACGRCAAQLCLAGGIVLTPLFATSQPWLVAAWLGLTAWLAAKEASSRVEYTYPKLYKHTLIALASSLSLVVAVTLGLGILDPKPWFSPRTWIPICGMLLGNSMTATALAAGSLTRQLATSQSQLEWQLARGATWREALSAVLQTTYTAALTPTINALSVTGVVFIPGMMTGQLLAGQSPLQASAYQVLIYFLIAAASCTSVQTLTQLTIRSLIDPKAERLRMCDATGQSLLQPIIPHSSNIFSWSTAKDLLRHLKKLWRARRLRNVRKTQQQKQTASQGLLVVSGDEPMDLAQQQQESEEDASARIEREMKLGMLDGVPIGGAEAPPVATTTTAGAEVSDNSSYFSIGTDLSRRNTLQPASVRYRKQFSENNAAATADSPDPYADEMDANVVLKADNMKVDRTTISLSLDIRSGDIVGIQGPSGVGKSQLLRTLAGLESLDRSTVSFHGRAASDMAMSEWRQKVALVPQDRPSLEGTPREFFERVLSFQSQRKSDGGSSEVKNTQTKGSFELAVLLGRWRLSVNLLDQPWSTLSGGEAQRISLAMAISLKPSVLLLDESTSALDEESKLTVEESLKKLGIPIVMVSHDREQIRRFCNNVIDLVPAGPFMRG